MSNQDTSNANRASSGLDASRAAGDKSHGNVRQSESLQDAEFLAPDTSTRIESGLNAIDVVFPSLVDESETPDALRPEPASTNSPSTNSPSTNAVSRIAESWTDRPQRWDVPFGNDMTEEWVDALMRIEPFVRMDERRFTPTVPLRKILLNDARLVQYHAGDVVVREGDYGNSAFMVMAGKVVVTLDSLPKDLVGQGTREKKTSWQAFAQLWSNSRHRESRQVARAGNSSQTAMREVDGQTRIFLQDVPGILSEHRTLELNEGEFFGELAALSRSPRTATVIAQSNAVLLELRWQGLRDIMRRDPRLQQRIHELYRSNSLESHLRETHFLKNLSPEDVRAVAAETDFETHGSFEWHRDFKKTAHADPKQQIASEPIIAQEGHYTDGILLIRTGFARLSHRYGDGHRTVSYLGKGDVYGLAELVYAAEHKQDVPLQYSLRAFGYVDALRIPSRVVTERIFPQLTPTQKDTFIEQVERTLHALRPTRDSSTAAHQPVTKSAEINPGLMEFIAQHGLINGKATMIIDLDRCVRCDDCVRACATAHDNNPRFIRQGLRYGSLQFPNACMHCADPVCLIGCPTGAIAREQSSGNVVIHDNTCIGCRTCAESCPYHNIRMVEITDERGQPYYDQQSKLPIMKATKCDLCDTQLGGPACQRACSHDALIRIDMQDVQGINDWISR